MSPIRLWMLIAAFVCAAIQVPQAGVSITVPASAPTHDSSVTPAPGASSCDGSSNCIESLSTTTPRNGESMTLTGFHFDDRDTTSWRSFFTANDTRWSFEGASPADDGYDVLGTTTPVYVSDVSLYGSRSFRFSVSCRSSATCSGPSAQPKSYSYVSVGRAADDYWIGFDTRYNDNEGQWPNAYIKLLDTLGAAVYYWQPGAGPARRGVRPSTWIVKQSTFQVSVSNPGRRLENDRWYRIKLHWKSSSPFQYTAYVDGRQVFDNAPRTTTNLATLLFGPINACCWAGSVWTIDNWIDGLYVGDTEQSVEPPAAVYLDNACGGLTAEKVWQPRTMVSTTRIDITFTKGRLKRGAGCLYVVNQAGATSAGESVAIP